jgi:formylglycine-generating enzyme required for sulfatase activity
MDASPDVIADQSLDITPDQSGEVGPIEDASDASDPETGKDQDVPDVDLESRCPQGRGPSMIRVPWPAQRGGGYCIDSTEVTREQYAEFLSAGPSLAGQVGECVINNATFEPAEPCMQHAIEDYGAGTAGVPQVCVDWCDAVAFCAWAGKRQCAGDGSDPNNALVSEWYNACSASGTRNRPCGTCSELACNLGGPLDPPSDTCEGGFDGIFDMFGNVSELTAEYATDPFPQGAYMLRGYDVLWYDIPDGDKPDSIGCADNGYHLNWYHPYDHGDPYVGIRCCADEVPE